MSEWYGFDKEHVLAELKTDAEQGLSQREADRRLAEYGPNELIEQGRISPWRILWEQLTALMVLILIVAAAISALIGNYKDAFYTFGNSSKNLREPQVVAYQRQHFPSFGLDWSYHPQRYNPS